MGSNSGGRLRSAVAAAAVLLLTAVAAIAGPSRIAAGHDHTLWVKANGTLWAWGDNDYGQLGDGTITDRLFPVQIGADNNWVAISAGYFHSLGLKSDGTLWAWGLNNIGQLGDGTTTNRTSPVQIGTEN